VNRDQKAAAIAEIAESIQGAEAVFAVDYRGISVPQAAELRTRLRDADTRFAIVKNTLTERAADQVGADALKELLDGPTALAYVRGDVAAAAKAISDYARQTELLPFKGGLLNGETLDAYQIRSIARLPSRDVPGCAAIHSRHRSPRPWAPTGRRCWGVHSDLAGARDRFGGQTPAAERQMEQKPLGGRFR